MIEKRDSYSYLGSSVGYAVFPWIIGRGWYSFVGSPIVLALPIVASFASSSRCLSIIEDDWYLGLGVGTMRVRRRRDFPRSDVHGSKPHT